MKLKIGSRGSKLALWQSEYIRGLIMERNPGTEVEIVKIKTQGDKITDVALSKIGGKGLFVKEIEDALLKGEAHIAVHSMKDMPTQIPEGLAIVATPEREDPRDALVTKAADSLENLPKKARVGTSSLRRQSQIKNIRPDLIMENLRGNLDTRLKKQEEGQYDAIVLAAAGLRRMGWADKITSYIPFEICLSAVGQGIIAIEAKEENLEVVNILKAFNHEPTYIAAIAERAFLRKLEGGCQVPIAAHARILRENGHEKLVLVGLVGSVSGDRIIKDSIEAAVKDGEKAGVTLAETLLSRGAGDILKEVYGREVTGY